MNEAWLRMLAIIAVVFLAMKFVVLAVTRIRLTTTQKLAFFVSFSMRPTVFTHRVETHDARSHITRGALNLLAGAALLGAAMLLARVTIIGASIVAMIALSFILHFGILRIVAGVLRGRGFPAEPTFRAPLRARSLGEFWSRRWNVGFSEMVAIVVQRPVRRVAGENAAILAAFLTSGLLHELAISVPVGAGFGLPTLYFALHGALVTAEKRWPRLRGRAWTLLWLALPAPLVFHPWFVRGVVWPLLGIAAAG